MSKGIWSLLIFAAAVVFAKPSAAFVEEAAAVRNASGPALLCDGDRRLYAFSSQLPEGSRVSPGRDVVAFVLDGRESVLRVIINRENPAEFLIDRLPIVIFSPGSEQQVIAMEVNDLIGEARLYAISFDRREVAMGWGAANYETQGGGAWYLCRGAAIQEIVPPQ